MKILIPIFLSLLTFCIIFLTISLVVKSPEKISKEEKELNDYWDKLPIVPKIYHCDLCETKSINKDDFKIFKRYNTEDMIFSLEFGGISSESTRYICKNCVKDNNIKTN